MNANMDYSEIAPYDDAHFAENIEKLASEPGFEHAVRWVLPHIDFPTFIQTLKSCTGKRDFQTRIMQGAYHYIRHHIDRD